MNKEWLKQLLRRQGKTTSDLAIAINRDRAVVSRIMNGHQPLSLDQAKIFAEVLNTDLSDVLVNTGLADAPTAQVVSPGFSDSDAAAFIPKSPAEGQAVRSVAQLFGERPGVDVWRVKSRAMSLHGLVEGDFMLVDTHQAERVKAGDVVVAQVYNRTGATTVLRRFEPPVLIACSPDPADAKVYVVDGVNVVIRGKVTASWRTQ